MQYSTIDMVESVCLACCTLKPLCRQTLLLPFMLQLQKGAKLCRKQHDRHAAVECNMARGCNGCNTSSSIRHAST